MGKFKIGQLAIFFVVIFGLALLAVVTFKLQNKNPQEGNIFTLGNSQSGETRTIQPETIQLTKREVMVIYQNGYLKGYLNVSENFMSQWRKDSLYMDNIISNHTTTTN